VRTGRAGDRLSLSAVFLDRDGVVNRKAPEGDYITSWARFEFLPGALEGLRLLAVAGPAVVVATNQRGIARGRMTEAALADIHERMRAEVAEAGGRIDAVYHCPHEGGCECRKPGVGMFERAAGELGVRLDSAAVIGDRASDMQAAATIGALRVLVRGHDEPMPPVDHVADDLAAAARWVTDQGLRASAISE
jgi:D-glycero-D-manno-heptose 1,7-bisphosphate phosphatase